MPPALPCLCRMEESLKPFARTLGECKGGLIPKGPCVPSLV